MIMGNFLSGEALIDRMAARPPAVGLSHPTVVPTNFKRDEDHTEPTER
jgi:hypothetical protein